MGYRFELKLTKAPGTQQARILLKNHPRDENGNIPITPNCCGMAELEMAIDRLHAELEAIKKEAKRRFRQT
ncbi:MAG: hypothetical protein KAT62_00535 [Desulfuromonadales bacterium]|nr:hypothetical protein [Desulfuromonadales bacterium]